jgi:hypothetical protein
VSRIVFLLEERSMRELLEGMLPRLFPDLQFKCISHEGKQDLEKSVPRKLKAWTEPGARFIIVRDNDGGDCHGQKRRLAGLCEGCGRDTVLVRIACQELEAWYLGDPEALATAYGDARLAKIGAKARFRDPDEVTNPSRALADLVPEFQKLSGARRLAQHLTPTRNSSRSFQVFIEGVKRLAADL